MSPVIRSSIMSVVIYLMMLTAAFTAYFFLPPSVEDASGFPYKKTALITAAYFSYFYLTIFYQSMISLGVMGDLSKKEGRKVPLWEVKYGPISYKDRRIVAGNRTVGNALEQMPMFLGGLWLSAFVTSDSHASLCGWIYLAFRAFYGVAYVCNPNLIALVTLPNYVIIFYLWISIVKTCLS